MSDYGRRINFDSYYNPPEYPDPPETCQIKGCSESLYDDEGDPFEGIDADYGLCAPHNRAINHFPWISLCPECGRLHTRKIGKGGLPRLQCSTCYQCELVWSDMEAW